MNIKLSFVTLALLAAFSLPAYENYKQAADAANKNLNQKNFEAAKSDAAEALKLAEAKQKADAITLQARVSERSGDIPGAITLLETITSMPEASDNQKVSALQGIANYYNRNLKQPAKAVPYWEKIFTTSSFNSGARAGAACNIASYFAAEKNYTQSDAWIAKALAIPELPINDLASTLNNGGKLLLDQNKYDKAFEMYSKVGTIEKVHEMHTRAALTGLVYTSIGQGNLEAAMKYLADFEALKKEDTKLTAACAELAEKQNKIKLALQLRTQQFKKGPFYAKTVDESIARNFLIVVEHKEWDGGIKMIEDMREFFANPPEKVKVPALTPEQSFELDLLMAAFEAKGDVKKIKAPKADVNILPADKLASVYFRTAKIFAQARQNDLAEYFAATAPETTPVYEVTFVEKAPGDVSAWRNSAMVKDPAKRETRFKKYNEKAAALLINDVNVVRDSATKYQGNENCTTSFFVSADPRGIYIYAENKDDKLDMVRSNLEYGGMLEMYLQPGTTEAYFQWMVYPGTGKVDVIDWMPNNPSFRSMRNYLKCSIDEIDGGLGVVMFIPWSLVYDKLPQDGDAWPLGVVPFVRAGGFTWGSGQVHELDRFGKIKFNNISKFMPQIKREIVMNAWGKYRSEIGEAKIFWADPVKGDAEFNVVLTEALAPYEEFGKKVSSAMSDAEVEELFNNAVPVWNESVFFVDNLRKDYLQKKLVK